MKIMKNENINNLVTTDFLKRDIIKISNHRKLLMDVVNWKKKYMLAVWLCRIFFVIKTPWRINFNFFMPSADKKQNWNLILRIPWKFIEKLQHTILDFCLNEMRVYCLRSILIIFRWQRIIPSFNTSSHSWILKYYASLNRNPTATLTDWFHKICWDH
jgi:hypothetical protein